MIDLTPIAQYINRKSMDLSECDELGYVVWTNHNYLSFLIDIKYLDVISANPAIKAVLWDFKIPVPDEELNFEIIICENPLSVFTLLHNSLENSSHYDENQISLSAKISENVAIASTGVTIEENVTIEPFVTIYSGVTISKNSIIRSGARIGSDALDVKTDPAGNVLMTRHLGTVWIGEEVEVGHNSVVDRAVFKHQTTKIGSGTKIGALSNISHGVSLGSENILAAGVQICGSTNVGDRNWFGPNVVVSHMLKIGNDNYVALGSNVFQNLENSWKVIGLKVFRDKTLI